MIPEYFSARTYDANFALDAQKLTELRHALAMFGAVHVQNTGIVDVQGALEAMHSLGFSAAEQFQGGGRTSEHHQQKWVERGLRRLDFYPPHLYLLPNNEVQYQRCSPRRVLFYCRQPAPVGGRAFLHSAADVESRLHTAGLVGQEMLDKLTRHGLMIETGFLDAHDPRKPDNYFQSWQERFGCDDPDAALSTALARTSEYDHCWWREETGSAPNGRPLLTLMTRITLSAFKIDPRTGRRYLRFPRIAFDGPSAKNGYRQFPLGNGESLTDAEISLLRAIYMDTRQGISLRAGDLVLFDNMRFGHSREPFCHGEREVFVGMGGELWDDITPQAKLDAERERLRPPPEIIPCANKNPSQDTPIYECPPHVVAPSLRFTARTFDAGGTLSATHYSVILGQFARYGALHIRNTGLRCEHGGALPQNVLDALQFSGPDAFPWGGLSSGRTTRRALSPALRATDDYPQHLWLLPHNEILYQRQMPSKLLFFSATDCTPDQGGRTFVHSAETFESWLRDQGPPGLALIDELRIHGFLIEMGFLDENHPEKSTNYFRSWQDRFQTHDRHEAQARCLAATLQFDECWWVEERTQNADKTYWTLMTRIRIPAYYHDPITHQESLFFPRIALDAPALLNGYRRYPLGNGRDFSPAELDLLLNAFLATREGVHWQAGDILLVDNIRYGHSREAFSGPRSLGVAMAGMFSTEHMQMR